MPDNPRAWRIRVAGRRITDHVRSEQARRGRESIAAAQHGHAAPPETAGGIAAEPGDTLILMFMCCHPALTTSSAIALTLRAVGGLTTAEIARAFLVPRRRSRSGSAAQSRASGRPAFRSACRSIRNGNSDSARCFTCSISSSTRATRPVSALSWCASIFRVKRSGWRVLFMVLLPEDAEVAGLLALMLLTDARRRARTGQDGELIRLTKQDRTLWDRELISEGVALVEPALSKAMVHGPAAGLDLLDALDQDGRLNEHHRLDAVRAHLLELADDREAAITRYRTAAGRTTNIAERIYLLTQAARLREPVEHRGADESPRANEPEPRTRREPGSAAVRVVGESNQP